MALTEEQKNEIRTKYSIGVEPVSNPVEDRLNKIKALRTSVQEDTGFVADIKGIGSDIKESLTKRGENISATQESFQKGETGLLRGAFQKFGQVAGGVSDVIGSTVMGGIKALTPQPIQEAVGEAVQTGVENVMETDTAQKLTNWYSNLDEKTKRDIGSVAGITSLATDLTGMGLAKKPVVTGVKKGIETAVDVSKQIPRVTSKLKTIAQESIKPSVTPEKAIGEVLQGKALTEKGTKQAIETIKQVDTKGIKTFADLGKKIEEKIPQLAKQVDDDLAQDTTKIPLEYLKVVKSSKGGQPVEIRFVDDALTQLDELYGKTGDAVSQQNIREVLQTAKTQGLTRQEVNDIAREYGKEFGQKAFSKIGEPLTSVNAQMYENVRKGLKDIARQGIKGKSAKKADELMSRLYNTQTLVKRNVEAVNKLMNRIEERGLVEKVGYIVSKYADVLSGGALRGFIGGILPRGAGYKTLNALDLEKLLERNLKIIQDAGKAKTVKQFKDTIKQIETSVAPIKKKFDPTKQGGFVRIGKETPKTVLPKSKVNESVSSLNDTTLIKEAKKYKSADEFVKARQYAYHGSPNAKSFDSFKPSTSGELGPGVYFSRDKNFADSFAQSTEEFYPKNAGTKEFDISDMKFKVLSKQEFLDIRKKFFDEEQKLNGGKWEGKVFDNAIKKMTKSFEDKGFSGYYVNSEKQGVVFPDKLNQLKTKSKLEQIWKEANTK